MSSTTTRSKIGSDDIKWWDGVNDTFTRLTSTGGSLTLNAIGSSVVDVLEAYGNGTGYTRAVLQSAIDAIGRTSQRSLLLRPGTWAIDDDITVSSNLTLVLPPGAILSVATGKTVTINGSIEAGPYQIFSWTGTGAVTFGSNSKVFEALPEWWGAVGDGTTDDTTAIAQAKTATVAAGIWLKFLAGKTYATNKFSIDTSNTKVSAYGAKLLHNGSNENFIEINTANTKGVQWQGGTLIAKQNAADPTDAVLYIKGLNYSLIKDVTIYAGVDDYRTYPGNTLYADYGIHLDGAVDFGTYYNVLQNIYVHGAKVEGVRIAPTADYCNGNTFMACTVLGNEAGVNVVDGRFTQFIGGFIEANNAINLTLGADVEFRCFGTHVEGSLTAEDIEHAANTTNLASYFLGSYGNTPPDATLKQFGLITGFSDIYSGARIRFKTHPSGSGGYLRAEMDTNVEIFLMGRVTGDTYDRFDLNNAGRLRWGAGGATAVDCKIEREAADFLAVGAGDTFRLDRVNFRELAVEPSNKDDGDVVYADGVGWNPGAGAGLYVRTGGAWVKLH